MSEEILTTDDYIKILQERFKTKEVEFKNAHLEPMSDTVEGYLGEHYKLKIDYLLGNVEGTVEFFIKTNPTKSEIQKQMTAVLNAYQKEIFLYNYLFKEYEKSGYDISFVPKSYYCKHNQTIVMENMQNNGYKLLERKNFFDMEHCKAVLKSLANYHANFIAYEEKKSKELGRTYRLIDERPDMFIEILFRKDGMGYKFFSTTFNLCLEFSELMPESEDWKKTFAKKIKNFNHIDIFCKPLPYRKVSTHGDLWTNNMLFKYANGVPSHCCLIDFQLLRYHHPSYDALLVLYCSTPRDFRKKHLNYLLNYYYDTFENILSGYGNDAKIILPREHFMATARSLEPAAVLQGAALKSVTLLPAKVLHEAVSSGGNDLGKIMFSDARIRYVLEGCEADAKFRSIVTDDMYDIYDNFEG